MKPIVTPGGIALDREDEDDVYAKSIAQDDEEERPRQPAPDLIRCKVRTNDV